MTQARLILAGLSLAVLAALVAVLLWYRGEAIRADADRDKWKETAQTWERANASNVRAIAGLKKAREDNDKIAADLRRQVQANASREVETRTIIREIIRNDPEARTWADLPVPDSLRHAAQAGDNH
jgi:LysB family phage lysis regulatory protein